MTSLRGPDWEGVRLHVVSGKGGTGKTTVAAALALALATGGRRVLLVEVEGRQGIARLFDVPPLPYEELKVAEAPDSDAGPGSGPTDAVDGEVYGLAVEPHAAVAEYLDMYYRLGRAAKTLERFGAIEFATTIAPGLRDVLLTGKTYEAVRRKDRRGKAAYDAVVMDAPPTGRLTRFLNVNQEVAGLARMGPIHRQAGSIMSLIRSPQTAVHLVTILEEMPVQETVDAAAELRAADIPVGAVIVNQVRLPVLRARELAAARRGTLDGAAVAKSLAQAGLSADEGTVGALLDEGREHAERVALERTARQQVVELGRPTYELANLPQGIDVPALYELADDLHQQGAA